MFRSRKKLILLTYVFGCVIFGVNFFKNTQAVNKNSVVNKVNTLSLIINEAIPLKKIDQQINTSIKSVFVKTQPAVAKAIHIFDLNQVDIENYEPIKCKKSAEIYVKTTLCIHDLNKDSFVSKDIWNNGVWEPSTARTFLSYVYNNPEWLVFDVGAQIGQYTLFSAKIGRKVVTVEPFYDNILRIHKAAGLEKLQNNITLVRNAVSDKANEIKRLYENKINIGGQGIINDRRKFNESDMKKDKYLVKTIVFNDLVEYLPKRDDGKHFEKAIMKIDIEGFEPFAFEHADKLFDAIDVQVIFMEWGNLPPSTDRHSNVVKMINFLLGRNLVPRGDGDKVLKKEDWKNWPWDIIWVHSNINI